MARDEAYQEAKRRIEAARQEGATELDLSRLGLTEVPEAIASLTQLQDFTVMLPLISPETRPHSVES